MIFNEDIECPYCGKENNAAKLEEYLEDLYFSNDFYGEEEVICEYCKKKFEIEVEVEIITPDFTITEISKIKDN